jgi:hypothetical protein
MAKGMNVELDAQTFPLLSTRTSAPVTNLDYYNDTCKKERGGASLTLLYQYNYVSHTPDGKTKKMKDDEGEVLEVKVVFGAQESISALFKKYRDQLHLGLLVHR